MQDLFINLLAAAIAGAIGRFWQPLFYAISGALSPDLPKLKGVYNSTYDELDATRTLVTVHEVVEVHQIGRNLFGKITRPGNPKFNFKFSATIHRSIVTGTFSPIPRPPHATGVGTFQLKCKANDDQLVGRCIWLDFDTTEIETSAYEWKKQ